MYPHRHREDYGQMILQLFDDVCRDAPPDKLGETIRAAFTDTILSIVREQFEFLMAWIKRRFGLKSKQRSFYGRHRVALVASAAVVVVGVGSVLGGFWGYNGPWGYATRVVSNGMAQENLSKSWNGGWDDVTANFVADHIQAKYYGDERKDVGVKSTHAWSRTFMDHGKTYSQSLEENLNTMYAKRADTFDALTCSTQAPTSVRYVRGSRGAADATMLASFTYANQDKPNVVMYSLMLDQSKTEQGDWKVAGVNCISLEAQDVRPYTTSAEELRARNAEEAKAQGVDLMSGGDYDRRNDRSFGSTQ